MSVFITVPHENLNRAVTMHMSNDLYELVLAAHDVIQQAMQAEFQPDLFASREVHDWNVKMWEGYEPALMHYVMRSISYLFAMDEVSDPQKAVLESIMAETSASLVASMYEEPIEGEAWPHWLRNPRVIDAHRAYLVWKNSEYVNLRGWLAQAQPLPIPVTDYRMHAALF